MTDIPSLILDIAGIANQIKDLEVRLNNKRALLMIATLNQGRAVAAALNVPIPEEDLHDQAV